MGRYLKEQIRQWNELLKAGEKRQPSLVPFIPNVPPELVAPLEQATQPILPSVLPKKDPAKMGSMDVPLQVPGPGVSRGPASVPEVKQRAGFLKQLEGMGGRLSGVGVRTSTPGPSKMQQVDQNDLMSLYVGEAHNQINQQEDQLKELKAFFAKKPSGAQSFLENTNLAPLANWIDFLNDGKTNMLGMWSQYSGYQTPQQRKDTQLKIQTAINKAENNLSTQRKNLFKELLDSQANQQNLNLMYRVLRGTAGLSQDNLKWQDTIEKQERDYVEKTILKDKAKVISSFGAIDVGLEPNEEGLVPISDITANLGPAARVISQESGVLTNQDIARVFPNMATNLRAKIMQWFSGDPLDIGSAVDEKTVAGLKRLVKLGRRNYVRLKLHELIRSYRDASRRTGVVANKMFEKGRNLPNMYRQAADELVKMAPDYDVEDVGDRDPGAIPVPILSEFYQYDEKTQKRTSGPKPKEKAKGKKSDARRYYELVEKHGSGAALSKEEKVDFERLDKMFGD